MNPITDNLETWTTAKKNKKSVGRGSSKKQEAYGIKKLRELILELAVRGKLVPQDASDEPASVLLERIAKERTQLVKEKKIQKPKSLPEISAGETSFLAPKGWELVRLNDLGEWGAGATPLRSNFEYYGGDIPWFKSGELVGDHISTSEETITTLALKETSVRYNKVGDVLIAMYGATIGKTSILKVPATTNQAVCACTPFSGFSNIFLLMLLKAYKNRFIGMGAGGAQPNISREKIIATIISLPPTKEQHRIVAKVDELMALCDQLEQQQSDQSATHQTLVETLLNGLIESVTLRQAQNEKDSTERPELVEGNVSTGSAQAADFFNQLIAQHFDTLFTTEQSIDQLKQTILQLAVMGKLVPQDPNDEPASVLLEIIAKEKTRLIEAGKIKKQKALPEIGADEQLFELPDSWEWVRLAHLLPSFQNGASSRGDKEGREIVVLRLADIKNWKVAYSGDREHRFWPS